MNYLLTPTGTTCVLDSLISFRTRSIVSPPHGRWDIAGHLPYRQPWRKKWEDSMNLLWAGVQKTRILPTDCIWREALSMQKDGPLPCIFLTFRRAGIRKR